MMKISLLIRLGWLLGIALLAPVALPAGGGSRNKTQIMYTKSTELSFAGDSCFLLKSPSLSSPTLCRLNLSTPLKVIRIWDNNDGNRWIQVRILSSKLLDMNPSASDVSRFMEGSWFKSRYGEKE